MGNAQCSFTGCSHPAVVSLRAQSLCLEHFCCRCYEFLKNTENCGEPEATNSTASSSCCSGSSGLGSSGSGVLRMADECARKALDISLNTSVLSNLERARLLDILLWCGDVTSMSSRRKREESGASNVRTFVETRTASEAD